MTDDQKIVISSIENILIKKGWSKSKLARELNKSRGWASQLMKNQIKQISLQTFLDIARVLSVEPSSLLPSSNPGPSSASLEEFITRICEQVSKRVYEEEIRKKIS
jgi:transcriptional regulator with XRE-family HTH domain